MDTELWTVLIVDDEPPIRSELRYLLSRDGRVGAINEAGNGVNQAFIDYVLPLIQGEADTPKENGLPRFARLKKVIK